MKVDLHLHSRFSWDSNVKIKDYISRAEEKQFQAISITDHDSTESHNIIDRLQKNTEVMLIPGQEITTSDGHLLIYGWISDIQAGLSMKQTVREVKKQDGYCIAAHPFDPFRMGSYSKVFDYGVDGIETLNASTWLVGVNWFARRALKSYPDRFGVGNSDAHRLTEFGVAWTEIPTSQTLNEVFENLHNGTVHGNRLGVLRKLSRFIRRKL